MAQLASFNQPGLMCRFLLRTIRSCAMRAAQLEIEMTSAVERINQKLDDQTSALAEQSRMLAVINERQDHMLQRLGDGSAKMDNHESRLSVLEHDRTRAQTAIKILHAIWMAFGATLAWVASHLPQLPLPR